MSSLGTNYFLVTDIARPKKSLWMVYRYEYYVRPENATSNSSDSDGGSNANRYNIGGVQQFELDQKEVLEGAGLFDMACLAESLDDFVDIAKI